MGKNRQKATQSNPSTCEEVDTDAEISGDYNLSNDRQESLVIESPAHAVAARVMSPIIRMVIWVPDGFIAQS